MAMRQTTFSLLFLCRFYAFFIARAPTGNSKDGNLDAYSYLTFMRGVCFRHLGSIDKAIECFNEVLSWYVLISELISD